MQGGPGERRGAAHLAFCVLETQTVGIQVFPALQKTELIMGGDPSLSVMCSAAALDVSKGSPVINQVSSFQASSCGTCF